MNNMYQKEFENIVTLICNKHSPQKLIQHVLTETQLLDVLIQKPINSIFEFPSGRKLQSGFFATFCEVSSIINDSENEYVKEETDKNEKWRNFCYLYIEPIKQRFKDGLLAPPPVNNNTNNPNHTEFSNFESQEKHDEQTADSTSEDKSEDNNRKPNINEFLNQLIADFNQGRRLVDTSKSDLEHHSKKDEMELLHDEEEDHYHYTGHDIHNNHILYGSEKLQSENHEFYDNNFWATSLIVDELDLNELTQSL